MLISIFEEEGADDARSAIEDADRYFEFSSSLNNFRESDTQEEVASALP